MDPWTLDLVGQIDGMAYVLHLAGPLAYVAVRRSYIPDRATELAILSLDDPTRPRRLGALMLPELHYFCVADRYAYATTVDSLRIVDLSDPRRPLEVGHYPFDPLWPPGRVEARQGYVFVAASNEGLLIFDVSNPRSPHVISTYPPPQRRYVIDGHAYRGVGRMWILAVIDAYVYASALGLHVIDVTDPSRPREAAHHDMVAPILMKPHGQYLFLSTDVWPGNPAPGLPARLHIFNIVSPRHPHPVGTYDTEAAFNDIAIVGRYALAVRGTLEIADDTWLPGELQLLDVGDPAHPAHIATYPLPAWRIAVANHYVYLASDDGLRVFAVNEWR